MEASQEYETMMDAQYDLTAAINAHTDLIESSNGDALSDDDFATLKKFQQDIINLSYKLKEATEAYRKSMKTNSHIAASQLVTNPLCHTRQNAQKAPHIAQSAKGTENGEQIKADWNPSTQQCQKLPLPVLQSNVILQPNGNAAKLSDGKQTFYLIKVPPNNGGQLNLVPVHNASQTPPAQLNGNGSVNGILVNNLNHNNNNISSSVDNNDLPSNKVISVPSPLITHTVAVEATKGLETMQVDVKANDSFPLWPKQMVDEEDDEVRVSKLAKKQAWFLSLFELCDKEKMEELSQKRGERRRRRLVRSTFSTANIEERKRSDLIRKKRRIIVPEGKTKLEFKKDLEEKSQKLKAETEKLLKRHEEAQRNLAEERSRRALLEQKQRAMEEVIEKMRSVCAFMESSKMFVHNPSSVKAP